jgi:DNA-binding NtrC family response regulator
MNSEAQSHILIVDDEAMCLQFLQEVMVHGGYKTTTSTTCARTMELINETFFDLILLDVNLPDGSGLDLCKKIKESQLNCYTPIILVTGYGSIKMAVEAMQLGAFYFASKPVGCNELLLLVKRGLEHSALSREVSRLKNKLLQGEMSSSIIGKSHKMQQVFTAIAQVAPRDTTVLIQGESGTGKELVARAIHQNSPRCQNPFVTIDCGSISENLLESELFGHVKGAFTGAVAERKGLFQRANYGTLFLDEVGNLPLALQVKLLRALQEHEVTPVGSDKTIKVDVRIIAATNMSLTNMVAEGTFRNDLFFRLNVVNIQLPSLKERAEDIPLLAQYFLSKRQEKGSRVAGFSKSALKLLLDYDWPGNIRELEHAVEHAEIVAKGENLQAEDWPEALRVQKQITMHSIAPLYSLEQVEKIYIEQVLKHSNYNQNQATAVLGIDRKSLWRKIKKYSIEVNKINKT